MTTPLGIWYNMNYPAPATELLKKGVAPHQIIFARSLQSSNLDAGAADPQLAEGDVAFGQPNPEAILNLPRLKWVHLTSAGYERYDRPDLRWAFTSRGTILTNSSSVYDEPCAEHALSMMLALARRLPDAWERQRTDRGWPAAEIRANCHLLVGQTALILGHGAIARRLIELLTPLRMNLMAIRRTPTGRESIPTYPESEVEKYLPQADHIVDILPGGAATSQFMNAQRLSLLKPTAIFYNIGRGGTVDQEGILSALRSNRLAAAYLDVTTPEPLPADHPLWTTPNCYITPHTAGGHADEFERLMLHFLENLRRFTQNERLLDRVI
ncbi:MAG TPA: D-2-hydroxyacid dehydrogenase [Tepidisphaeraceae bacterium]|jgi:phosphoglycerate dehydrogenase-like enzyme|nr:D-2-hydroxyacid dehydrogenase [Tepidisphaeraceae bacterium]